MKLGKFIVVEGLEGAGKSTAIQFIEKYLRRDHPDLIVAREPGGTLIGEALRSLIKHNQQEPFEPMTELLLLYAARVQLVEQVIRPALQQGRWILLDRFELSTYAYQGGGRRISREKVQALSTLCLEGLKPDLIFFLDIIPEIGLKRAAKRGCLDRIEQESLDFFTRVRAAYLEELHRLPQAVILDASAPLAQIETLLLSHLETFIHEPNILS